MFCIRLSDAAPVDRVGGKAANLARVHALGLRVPETVVLERGAFRHALEAYGLEARLRDYMASFENQDGVRLAERHREITNALCDRGLPVEVKREVREVVGPLLAEATCGLAVRSSAVYEDSEVASFAGVFESWVGLTGLDEIEQRILQCWSSAFAPRALRYLERMTIAPHVDAMAVMIQQVIPAASSGVAYTADPDSGDPWRFVVRATPGLSIDLMSGSGVGDSFHVEWDTGSITERQLEVKSSWLEATAAGVRRHEQQGEAARRPALTDAEVAEVSDVARRLDAAFSRRLDVEFVVSADDVWVVQTRPLTALPPFFPHEMSDEDRARTWQRGMFLVPLRGDLPQGFITPLYQDLSDAEMWQRYQPDDIVFTVFCKETHDVNGYRYTPAERMPMFADYFEDPSGYELWLDRNEPRYRGRWDRHQTEIEEIRETAGAAVRNTTTAAELIPAMLRVRDRLWDLNAYGWSGPQSLGWMCEMLLSHKMQQIAPEFLSGPVVGGGMDSYTFEVTRSLQELGRAIHEPPVRTAFDTLGLGDIVTYLSTNHPACEFLAAFEAFCWRFGKTPPSWRGRPPFWDLGADEAAMMHTIRCAMQGLSRDVVEVQRVSRLERDQREQELRRTLAETAPDVVPSFDKILAWTRYWSRALNDRHGLTAGLLWERELVWHVGRRLCDEGVLDAPEDVLAVRADDLRQFASGSASRFRDLVEARRREVRRHLRLQPPDTLGFVPQRTPAPEHAEADTQDEPAGAADSFSGAGIGHGEVTGVALSDPGLLDALRPDDILVLPHDYAFHYADWHSLLTLVKAVVSPGRPSHHLAQVARECGVPVISHVKADLGCIEDGARLHVDARTGVVRLLR